jgi:hypothetical protein
MAPKQRHPPASPMTLGNMHALGVLGPLPQGELDECGRLE